MNILITGTSSGIGEAMAAYYLENGHQVFGISRRENDFLNGFPSFHFLSQDLTLFDYLEGNVKKFLKPVAQLDRVILNAGYLNEIRDMKDTDLESMKRAMDINVWSNKLLLDILISSVHQIDQVVAISSGVAVNGSRGWNGYAISKAALNMLIQLYAAENPGIHFTSLAPGIIDTRMQDYIASISEDEAFPVIQNLKKVKGTPHMPGPEEAAPQLAKAIEKIQQYRSGSFIDIREI